MEKQQMPGVVFPSATHQGLQKGINQIVAAVYPSLGPRSRIVAVERFPRDKTPELLDDGGVIARRIIQLPDRDADVGAMLIRQLLCRLNEEVGDGTATAAVLFQSAYNQGVQYVAAGGNAMRLRRCLEEGVQVILDELTRQTMPLEGQERLAKVATSLCHDAALGDMLGEIFDLIGEYGQLDIRPSDGTLFAGTEDNGLFYSADRGRTWRRLGEACPERSRRAGPESSRSTAISGTVNGIVLSPEFPAKADILVLLEAALLVSRDGGHSWSDWQAGLAIEPYLATVAAPRGLDPGAPLLVGLVGGSVLRIVSDQCE